MGFTRLSFVNLEMLLHLLFAHLFRVEFYHFSISCGFLCINVWLCFKLLT